MSGTRITVPPLEINLYKKGFDGVCKLDRKADGEKLSSLVERISEPLVIALDAPWGAGKSVFLQCWVGAHTLENQGTATTVYFDAFKHDYMDDPLVSIVQAISERIEGLTPKETDTEDTSKIDTLKQTFRKATVYAPALGRAALRMSVAVGTGGFIRNIDDVAESLLDEAAQQGAKELTGTIGDFWKAEEARINAMEGFRKYLKELAAEQKLVIVIDELDRCRPDYALNLLEVIKHFFDVDNVHFVLGVNLAELQNSVKARYGSGVDAAKYLQKFVSITMPLTVKSTRHQKNTQVLSHFRNAATKVDLNNWQFSWLRDYLEIVDHHAGISLRDVEKIATLAKVCPEPSSRQPAALHLYIGLIILKIVSPECITKARKNLLMEKDVFNVLALFKRPHSNSYMDDAHVCWRLATKTASASTPKYLDEAMHSQYQDRQPKDVLKEVIAECLDAFELNF